MVHSQNAKLSMLKLDIRRFYPSSDGRRVFSFFREDLRCGLEVSSILFKLCTIRKTSNAQRAHLPTGGVTSPILAYFCYQGLFRELAVLAQSHDAMFSIMADDITFSGRNVDSLLKPSLS